MTKKTPIYKYMYIDGSVEIITEVDADAWYVHGKVSLINPMYIKIDTNGMALVPLLQWTPFDSPVDLTVDSITMVSDVIPSTIAHYIASVAMFRAQAAGDQALNPSETGLEISQDEVDAALDVYMKTHNSKKENVH